MAAKRGPGRPRKSEAHKKAVDKKRYARRDKTPAKKKARAQRRKARSIMGLKKGDPRVVDHVKPISKGGTNARSNLRVTTRKKNRSKSFK